MPSSGSFAVIDKTKANKWTSKTVANVELGISWTESLTDAQSKYDSTDGGPYAAMATRFVKVGSSKVSDAATLDNALAAIKKLTGTFTDAAVLSGFYCSPISIAEQQVQDAWVQDESKDSISVPRASNDGVTADTKAFLISVSGKNVSAVPLGTVVSDDAVSIDVLPSSMTKSEAYARYVALHNGVIENDSYADYPTSFIVLANGAEVDKKARRLLTNPLPTLRLPLRPVERKLLISLILLVQRLPNMGKAMLLRKLFAMHLIPSFRATPCFAHTPFR